jgi:alkanesulfonate monooxygenase SsuD/methylene tetrahydromethanopterin reductase-like flavin-dependent oxidoreductase (luciferase family)
MSRNELELGQLIHTRHFIRGDSDADFDDLWVQARGAEAAGFDHVWLGDSVTLLNKGRGDCLTTMAALAMATSSIRIGTVPLLASLRDPVLLAQALATLDVISKGRILIGVSPGPVAEDIQRQFQACGVPPSQKAGRLSETIEIMRRLWADDTINFEGKYDRLEQTGILPKPLQRPSIPIWIAADTGEAGFRRAARLGDGWITALGDLGQFIAARRKVDAFAEEFGRAGQVLPTALYATFNLNADGDRARTEGWAWMEDFYNQPRAALGHHCTIFGTPEDCATLLRGFVGAGLTAVIARFASPELDTQRHLFAKTQRLPLAP